MATPAMATLMLVMLPVTSSSGRLSGMSIETECNGYAAEPEFLRQLSEEAETMVPLLPTTDFLDSQPSHNADPTNFERTMTMRMPPEPVLHIEEMTNSTGERKQVDTATVRKAETERALRACRVGPKPVDRFLERGVDRDLGISWDVGPQLWEKGDDL